jgi:magnesium-transporting ATPase (P-type)
VLLTQAALVSASKNLGIIFEKRVGNIVDLKLFGRLTKWTILNTLEFTSERKRMSVVAMNELGEIILMTKGSDSVIYERLSSGQVDLAERTEKHLIDFSNEGFAFLMSGLRTLLIAYRVISQKEYEEWNKVYHEASISLTDRDTKLEEVHSKLESNLTLVGASAVEGVAI